MAIREAYPSYKNQKFVRIIIIYIAFFKFSILEKLQNN